MAASKNWNARALTADDLDRVVAIDQVIVGRSRRGYFQKRLEAAIAEPHDFVVLGVDDGTELLGYAIARIHEGEFGTTGKIAVLDTIGVDPEAQAKGIGRMLMDALDNQLAKWGVDEIRSQVDWRFTHMLNFFEATGFTMATAQVLECDTAPEY